MSRTKRDKFAELNTMPNVIQRQADIKGKWRKRYFNNKNPIIAELGCGRGDFINELARCLPQSNCIGVDLKGARLWRGAKAALSGKLTNVIFLRTSIRYIEEYFELGEIDEIWLTFPDPFSKRRHASLRLTAAPYLEIYRRILKPGGRVHLKTDDQELFDFTLTNVTANGWQVLETIDDLYAAPIKDGILYIQTKYERKHLADGRTIKYLRFG